ncbi:MAG: GlsB/YeaQ/YmgE family stress response membrane protein [Blastococcus sp.]
MDIGGILVALLIGLVAGFIARAVIPGKQDMGIAATLVLGLIGSLVGNLLGNLIFDGTFEFDLGGWWASIIGAIIVLGIYVAVAGRGRKSVTR